MNEISSVELEKLGSANQEVKRLRKILSIEDAIRTRVIWAEAPELNEIFPDLEFLGAGAESIVFVDPADQDKVISIGFRQQSLHGVAPFSELRNFHNLIESLFPEHLPHLNKAKGNSLRDTSRQRVYGRFAESTLDIISMRNRIEETVSEIGITDFFMDAGTEKNAILDQNNNMKYVDLVSGSAESVRNIDINKLKKTYQSKFHISDSELDKNEGWKTVMRSLKILKQLDTVNSCFEYMTHVNQYDLDNQFVAKRISSFHFSNTQDDDASRKIIRLWLTKATEAVKKDGHVYNNKHWVN